MISTCSQCGRSYDFASEEAANEPDRVCRDCYQTRLLRVRDPDAESREVELTLNGETRTVEITRLSPRHSWYAQCVVLVKCRTGVKLHRQPHPNVTEIRGRWQFCYCTVHNHPAIPVAWADDHPGSGWR